MDDEGIIEVGGISRMKREIEAEMGRYPKFKGQPHLYDFPEALSEQSRSQIIEWCQQKGWDPKQEFYALGGNYRIRFRDADGVQVPVPPSARR